MIKISESLEVALYPSIDLRDPENILMIMHLFQILCEDLDLERVTVDELKKRFSEKDIKLMEEEGGREKANTSMTQGEESKVEFIVKDSEKTHISMTPCKYHQVGLDIWQKKPHRLEGRFIPSESLEDEEYEEEKIFEEDEGIISDKFIEWGNLLYNFTNPYYGYIKPAADFSLVDNTKRKNILKSGKVAIPMIYWLNFLGPDFVNLIGREKILKAPFWKIEEFRDGGMLLISTPKIFDTILEEEKKKRKEIYEFLGLERVELDVKIIAEKIRFH